jgi:hypothetical protein
MRPLHSDPLVNLLAAIVVFWVIGLGIAVMLQGWRGAKKYVLGSLQALFYALASITEALAKLLGYAAKKLGG